MLRAPQPKKRCLSVSPKKILILAVVLAAVVAFFAFDLGRYFSLDFVKQS